MGKYRWWELAAVMGLYTSDDWGTAIGMQSPWGFEANAGIAEMCNQMVQAGVAKTYSQAVLFLDIGFQLNHLFWWWMK